MLVAGRGHFTGRHGLNPRDAKTKHGLTVLLLGLGLGGCEGDNEPVVVPAGEPTVTAAERATWDGARIYDEVCDRCHKMGVDGAPEPGDREAWAARLDKGRSTLLQHLHEGFNEMPPRGDCSFCSDAQLEDALDHILARSR